MTPIVTVVNPVHLGPIMFDVSEGGEDWVNNLYSATYQVAEIGETEHIDRLLSTSPTQLQFYGRYISVGTWTWTFKSTGYDDVVVEFFIAEEE